MGRQGGRTMGQDNTRSGSEVACGEYSMLIKDTAKCHTQGPLYSVSTAHGMLLPMSIQPPPTSSCKSMSPRQDLVAFF